MVLCSTSTRKKVATAAGVGLFFMFISAVEFVGRHYADERRFNTIKNMTVQTRRESMAHLDTLIGVLNEHHQRRVQGRDRDSNVSVTTEEANSLSGPLVGSGNDGGTTTMKSVVTPSYNTPETTADGLKPSIVATVPSTVQPTTIKTKENGAFEKTTTTTTTEKSKQPPAVVTVASSKVEENGTPDTVVVYENSKTTTTEKPKPSLPAVVTGASPKAWGNGTPDTVVASTNTVKELPTPATTVASVRSSIQMDGAAKANGNGTPTTVVPYEKHTTTTTTTTEKPKRLADIMTRVAAEQPSLLTGVRSSANATANGASEGVVYEKKTTTATVKPQQPPDGGGGASLTNKDETSVTNMGNATVSGGSSENATANGALEGVVYENKTAAAAVKAQQPPNTVNGGGGGASQINKDETSVTNTGSSTRGAEAVGGGSSLNVTADNGAPDGVVVSNTGFVYENQTRNTTNTVNSGASQINNDETSVINTGSLSDGAGAANTSDTSQTKNDGTSLPNTESLMGDAEAINTDTTFGASQTNNTEGSGGDDGAHNGDDVPQTNNDENSPLNGESSDHTDNNGNSRTGRGRGGGAQRSGRPSKPKKSRPPADKNQPKKRGKTPPENAPYTGGHESPTGGAADTTNTSVSAAKDQQLSAPPAVANENKEQGGDVSIPLGESGIVPTDSGKTTETNTNETMGTAKEKPNGPVVEASQHLRHTGRDRSNEIVTPGDVTQTKKNETGGSMDGAGASKTSGDDVPQITNATTTTSTTEKPQPTRVKRTKGGPDAVFDSSLIGPSAYRDSEGRITTVLDGF